MKTKEELNKELDAFLADSEKTLKAAKKLISSTETVLKTIRELWEAKDETSDAAAETETEAAAAAPAAEAADEPETAEPEQAEKAYTFEEVRGIMAGLSGSGKRAEVKALLTKYGVSKLSDISPEDYPALVQEAQVIANG